MLFNYWRGSLGIKKLNMIVRSIREGILKAKRKEPLFYSCEVDVGESEETVSEWIRDRGDVDLVADLCVARGWEDHTVVVVDCNKGRGVENLYMRAVGNLYVVRTEKRQEQEEEEEESIDLSELGL